MGYYEGQREQPCPRCGGVVATLFISVGAMSFSQRCRGCGTTEFTRAENALLGENASPRYALVPDPLTTADADDGSTQHQEGEPS